MISIISSNIFRSAIDSEYENISFRSKRIGKVTKTYEKFNSWVRIPILCMKTYDFDQRDPGKYQKRIGIYICGGAAGAQSKRADQPLASNM